MGARACAHRNKLEMPPAKVTESQRLLLAAAMQLGCTYKALMCSTYQAMSCFLRFYLSGGLLHIHDRLTHAHPEATLLFRLGWRKKRASSADSPYSPNLWRNGEEGVFVLAAAQRHYSCAKGEL